MLYHNQLYGRMLRRHRRRKTSKRGPKMLEDSKIIQKLSQLDDTKLITKQWKKWIEEGQINTNRNKLIVLVVTKFPYLIRHIPMSHWVYLSREEVKIISIADPEYILKKKMNNVLTKPKYKKVVRAWFDMNPDIIKRIGMNETSLSGEDWFNLISRNKNIRLEHLPDNWVEEVEEQIMLKKITGDKTKKYSKKRLNELLKEREKEEDVGSKNPKK